ncbi:MAG: manganese efflux pump [Clostridia bacterium]|nr:manganese efflux pump [Clostridia bacterium]
MEWSFEFFASSALVGVGLAMDAFSVSLADGLNEPCMRRGRMCGIAGVFAFFQALMPFIGWVCVHSIVQYFESFQKFIPWIALGLLGFIGGKMLYEGIMQKGETEVHCVGAAGLSALLLQGVATSIDALSVGFQIANYGLAQAIVCALLISFVTFFICLGGLFLGKKFGMSLAGKASVLGGCILIAIGLEIFITGII